MNEFYCTGEIRPYYRKGMSFPENFHFTVPYFECGALCRRCVLKKNIFAVCDLEVDYAFNLWII